MTSDQIIAECERLFQTSGRKVMFFNPEKGQFHISNFNSQASLKFGWSGHQVWARRKVGRQYLWKLVGVVKSIPPFIKPFRMGDVVRRTDTPNEKHLLHIIETVTLDNDGTYKYGTNIAAWFKHEDFELVRECDADSIGVLAKAILEDPER